MRFVSLFAGIGGIDLALESMGGRCVWHAEYDPAPSAVLAAHWPHVPNLGDITTAPWATGGDAMCSRVDVIAAGYPCQPFSQAGLRKGSDDERHLWPHVLAAITDLRPRYALLENVRGHLTLGFAEVLADLARIGFDAEWGVMGAATVGACHRRDRLWVAATNTDDRGRGGWSERYESGMAGRDGVPG